MNRMHVNTMPFFFFAEQSVPTLIARVGNASVNTLPFFFFAEQGYKLFCLPRNSVVGFSCRRLFNCKLQLQVLVTVMDCE